MKAKKIIALIVCAVIAISCTACTTTIEIVVPVGNAPTGNNTQTTPDTDVNTPPVQENTTAAPVQENTTAAGTENTTAAGTENTTAAGTENTTAAGTENTTAAAPSGAPQGKAAVLSYYNTAANKIKSGAKSVTRNYEDYQHNEEKLKLPSLLQSAGKSLIGSFLKKNETPQTYEGADVKNFYIPGEAYVSNLTEAQVKSAECKDNGSEYEITIVVNTEKNPTYGQGVSAGFEIIKTEDVMNAAGFIVKTFDTEYYDCTVKCKVDKATGNVTWINFATPIVMDVASSIGIDATVGMTFVKDYTVTW